MRTRFMRTRLMRVAGIALFTGLLITTVSFGSMHRQNEQRLNQQLMYAVLWHDHEQIKALLAEGADPNTRQYASYPSASWWELYHLDQPPNGGCPLMDAAFWGDTETVQMLLAHGAHPNEIDCGGATALNHAMEGMKSSAWLSWQWNPKGITRSTESQQYQQVFLLLKQHGGRANVV